MKRIVLLALTLAGATGCFRTSGLNRYQPDMYSVDQEVGMGREMSKEIDKEVTLLRHHALTQLVQGIGQRLLAHAARPEFKLYPFTFRVVDSSEINAFSLPGGPVYLNMGLIEIAETEDEVAAVIAHEMSHVAARHATEQMTALQVSQLAMFVALSAVGGISPAALEGTRLGYILGVLRYSRGMETEADSLGLELMDSAGYGRRGMLAMLRHIEDERRAEPVLLERLLSSHPMPDQRLAVVAAQVPAADEDGGARRESAAFARTKVLFVKD
ncbi:MAG: M48 family metalloprotease [Deltaproteobacteria bacterium]|nr:M48 family metalloprotease [Deltaproteobacteria bacterium]